MTWTVGTDVLAGRVVAAARRELGLSARALADRCGMPFGQLNKLETGLLMPSVAHLVALEEALRRAGMPGDRGVLLARIAEAEDRLRGTGAVVTRGRTDRDALGSPLREFVDRGLAARPSERVEEVCFVAEPGFVYHAQVEGVGPLLKRLRTRCGLTQAALSERSGVWRTLLSMLETGDREASLDQLSALESVFVELGVVSEPGALFSEVGRRLADSGPKLPGSS
jgi:transcriptional regulator with XRE-family HTH domain